MGARSVNTGDNGAVYNAMKTIIPAALVAAMLVAPSSIEAKKPQTKKSTLCETAYGVREVVVKKHGKRAPGRNICREGLRSKYNTKWEKPATVKQKAVYLRALKALNAPPPTPYAHIEAGPPSQPPAGTLSPKVRSNTGGRFAIPESIVKCESGGSYTARNPSSGAYGAYQIIPSTARAFNCDLSTPGGQDACAAKIWAGQGRGAWVC